MFVRVAPPVLVAPLWILSPSASRTGRPVAAYTSGYTTLVFHVARFLTGRIAICCKTRASATMMTMREGLNREERRE